VLILKKIKYIFSNPTPTAKHAPFFTAKHAPFFKGRMFFPGDGNPYIVKHSQGYIHWNRCYKKFLAGHFLKNCLQLRTLVKRSLLATNAMEGCIGSSCNISARKCRNICRGQDLRTRTNAKANQRPLIGLQITAPIHGK
jgi:hypothetical protein